MNTDAVTVIIARLVIPGKEREFEQWLEGIGQALESFPGFVGMQHVEPAEDVHSEHVVILQFDGPESLKQWNESEARKGWVRQAGEFTVAPVQIQHVSGMEGLFTLHQGKIALAPPRYKMFLVVSMGLYPLVVLGALVVSPLLAFLPMLVNLLIITLLNVALMTYVVTPLLTRFLQSWLIGGPAQGQGE